VPPEAGAARALPVVLTLMHQARAWKGDTDLGNRLADQAFGLLVRDAVLTIIGLQNAGKLLGRPVRPYRTRRHRAGIRGAQGCVMARPAAGCGVVAAGGLRDEGG
jgi:hypothetical protein